MLLDLGDLRVRSWRKDDLDALVRHANNPKIAANLRDQFPHPYTRSAAVAYLGEVRVGGNRDFLRRGVSRAKRSAGSASNWALDIARLSAEMGYWLGEPYWGRGLTTRAVLATSEWAFENYKLTRIFAMAFSHNVGSMRVLEKTGFAREGILRRSAIKNGVILDQVMFGKVR